MPDRSSEVIPPEIASMISAYITQAESDKAEKQGPEAVVRVRAPLINQKPVDLPVSVLRTSKTPNQEPLISPISRSDIAHYEQVSQQGLGETRLGDSTTDASIQDPESHTPKKPGISSLRRSPYQWWLLTPMDVLLTLVPFFFLSKVLI